MKRPEKEEAVARLTDKFRDADAIILTEYRGLSVPQVADLRNKLGRDTSYNVAKNTLARIAAKEAGIEGDYVNAAKTLRDFAKDNPALIVKGGFIDGAVADADAMEKIADLESRDVLLSRMAGALKGTMSKAANLFVAVPTKAVRTFDALREKQEKAA